MKKFIFWTLFLLFSSGFQVLTSYNWSISQSNPILYVDLCDDIYDLNLDSSDLSSSDILDNTLGSVAGNVVVQSILDDFEAVVPSYLELEIFPQSPTSEQLDLATNKTIEVCIESSNNPFEGGHAAPDFEDGKFIGCKIVLTKSVKDDILDFISTLTHEIGHCVGLDHPQETTQAIMSYFAPQDEIRLMIDDKMGLSHLFPRSGYNLEEQSTFGLSCSYK